MSIFSRIFKALQASTSEMGDAVVDANAISSFEKELDDASSEIQKMHDAERQIAARKKQAEVKLQQVQQQISALENEALAALKKNDNEKAIETAEELAQRQGEASQISVYYEKWSDNHNKLIKQIKHMETQFDEMTHQLIQVKATDIVHKAQEQLQRNTLATSSQVISAKQSLERIRAKQNKTNAYHEVAKELSEADSLNAFATQDKKHRSAADAKNIIAELKKKGASGNNA